ncbi:hypothetical protein [Bacillus massilinigeriensis]|uniref:hypothetical protein n=1 Tax=Bacillus massilionigeriensis TaxID=1805475 RepID=UPI001F22D170|nr:hypothetical protein [Bacillus massilionigeriensis]
MASPITIFKNNNLLFEARNIQEAARFLEEHFNSSKYKYYDSIERGYVYNIPYYDGEDEYHFVAPEEIAANRRKELEERGHKNARRVWLIPANPNDYDVKAHLAIMIRLIGNVLLTTKMAIYYLFMYPVIFEKSALR